MGGRGGKSGISEGEAVSKFTAKIIFNSAKNSNAIAPGDVSAAYDPKRATTTYNRARKRRIENFNAWFGKR